jgi:hypothetical protein
MLHVSGSAGAAQAVLLLWSVQPAAVTVLWAYLECQG